MKFGKYESLFDKCLYASNGLPYGDGFRQVLVRPLKGDYFCVQLTDGYDLEVPKVVLGYDAAVSLAKTLLKG